MAEEKQTPVEESAPKNGNSKNALIIAVLVINCILMGVVAFFQFQIHKKQSTEPSLQELVKAAHKEEGAGEGGGGHGEAKPAGAHGGEPPAIGGEAKSENQGILFPLDGFTANLAQGDGPRRYVRLEAVLKFSQDSNEEEFKAKKPQIRDRIISLLNSKKPEDLLKVEGKTYLKEEIKSAINSFLVDGKVLDVFYVGFQIN